MSRQTTLALAVVVTAIFVGGCGKLLSTDENKTILFNFKFQLADNSKTMLSIPMTLENKSIPILQKSIDMEAFDMVRIMVLDMSALGSWDEFGATDAGKEYLDRRYNWQGDKSNWAEWKKFLVDYIPVISDQTLEIQGNEAVGNVNGVVGHTSFAAGLFWGNRVKYWFSGDAHGEKG